MVRLIHLTTLNAVLNFGKKKYDDSLLPIAERAQSDRAEQYILRITERLVSFGPVRMELPEYELKESTLDKLTYVLTMLSKKGIISLREELIYRIGTRNAHKWYSDLNQDSIDQGLTMFEWMLALVTYRVYHESQRVKYKAALSRRGNDNKTQKLKERRDSIMQKIANVQKVIDDNTRYLADWNEKLRLVDSEINELSSE